MHSIVDLFDIISTKTYMGFLHGVSITVYYNSISIMTASSKPRYRYFVRPPKAAA